MKTKIKPGHKQALQSAIADLVCAQSRIDAILSSYPKRNKTTLRYQILGLCPQCGQDKANEEFYCPTCKDRHAEWSLARVRKIKDQILRKANEINSQDEPQLSHD